MESSNKHFERLSMSEPRARLRAARHGKITLVTCVAILGLIVLAGFVGNAGHVVTAKVSSQNAADAIAFSSAQWMARGMNSVTATNHLIGEMTALVVVIEALGGPEADEGMEDYPIENKSVDMINRKIWEASVIKGGYGASAFGPADKAFLKVAVNLISPEEKKAKHKAFATIYDSKRVLKRDLRKRLIIKTIANAGFFVPPPFGWATMIAAYAAHADSNIEIAQDIKEWLFLEGFEFLATKIKPIKVGIWEDKLIPALVKHGDLLAGKDLNAGPIRTSVVNAGLADSLERLGKVYDVEAVLLPGATTWTLPIEREPEASTNRGSKNRNEQPAWGTDQLEIESTEALIRKLKGSIEDQQDEISKRQFFLAQELLPKSIYTQDSIADLEKQIEDLLDTDPKSPLKEKVLAEKEEIRKLKEIKVKRIQELETQKKLLDKEFDKIKKDIEAAGAIQNIPGNLSIKGIPQDRMNQKEERYTQWVRATYPYVDAFRAPIIAKFKDEFENSEADKHYLKWTNRYTLVKAWQFRSGYRFKGEKGGKKSQWTKEPNSPRSKPLAMYVMKGAYPQQRPGSRDRKGDELWTKDTKEGKREAEKIFTVISVAHRDIEPLFSPVIYPVAGEFGITTFAQAIFYNGNTQSPAKPNAKQEYQAELGWDTLNWSTESLLPSTPEWGTKPTETKVEKWPWDIFKGATDQVTPAEVHLNWQAKLMPVTSDRYVDATGASVEKPELVEGMVKGYPFFNTLVHH